MTAMCFACRARPAGNACGGPYSAYCAECQPRSASQPKASQAGCAACGQLFATVSDFDRHQQWEGGTLTCLDPVSLGLELAAGAWGTPEGNANRARKARQLEAMRKPAPT